MTNPIRYDPPFNTPTPHIEDPRPGPALTSRTTVFEMAQAFLTRKCSFALCKIVPHPYSSPEEKVLTFMFEPGLTAEDIAEAVGTMLANLVTRGELEAGDTSTPFPDEPASPEV